MVAALLRSPRRMQSAGWLGRTKARPYVAIRCAGVSNSGSVPGGVSNGGSVPGGVSNGGSVPGGVSGGGIAALAVWGGTKKETQAPLSQRHACASHHREILKLNRNALFVHRANFFRPFLLPFLQL